GREAFKDVSRGRDTRASRTARREPGNPRFRGGLAPQCDRPPRAGRIQSELGDPDLDPESARRTPVRAHCRGRTTQSLMDTPFWALCLDARGESLVRGACAVKGTAGKRAPRKGAAERGILTAAFATASRRPRLARDDHRGRMTHVS